MPHAVAACRDTAQRTAVLYGTTTPICRSGRTGGANACTFIELCKEDGQAFSYNLEDIDALELLPGEPHIVYTFWVGMPLPTQEHILKLDAADVPPRSFHAKRPVGAGRADSGDAADGEARGASHRIDGGEIKDE